METETKVIRNGKVAVLYSPGYGAGWYTWNSNVKQCLFHPEIVKMVEDKKHSEITEELCEKLFGVDYFYAGGACSLTIEWIDEGTQFSVDEYDGFESIKTIESLAITA